MTFTPGVDMFIHCGKAGHPDHPQLTCVLEAGHEEGEHEATLYQRSDGSWSPYWGYIRLGGPNQPSRLVTWPALGPEHYTAEATVTRALLGFPGLIAE
jgi:hypothetical protein